MILGIYQSASGLDTLMRMQDVISNNLANVSTQGFKQQEVVVRQADASRLWAEAVLDPTPGAIQVTDVPTQLALAGDGYFTVDTAAGPAHTRCGDFQVNAEGFLVTPEGWRVQGARGDIAVGREPFVLSADGAVVQQGERVDQLRIVQGSGPMRPLGQTLVTWEDPTTVQPVPANRIQVMQGALEGSNVNLVRSMVDMLEVVRLYEANQKALESQDETLKQLISTAGRSA